MVVKHPNTEWRLIVHENGRETPDKPMRNHYGVCVATNQEVKRANEYLLIKKKELCIKIIKPRSTTTAFLCTITNRAEIWEIESYENAVKAGMGQTTTPHWKTLLPEERFPGKGYVPQAQTHGTIKNEDLESCGPFYRDVLGVEIVQLCESSFYAKHLSTPWFIVCLDGPNENRNYMTRYQRYTWAVESSDSVKTAHRELTQRAGEIDITELEDV